MTARRSWQQVPACRGVAGPRAGALRALGRAAAAGVLALAAAAIVAVPWAWQRATVTDPLRHLPGWSRRERRSWSAGDRRGVGRRPTVSAASRLLRTGAATVVLLLLALQLRPAGTPERPSFHLDQGLDAGSAEPDDGASWVIDPIDPDLTASSASGARAAAVSGLSWYPALAAAQGRLLAPGGPWRPIALMGLLDVSTPGLSISQGRRRSWQPPACTCPTTRVWVYGGSTAFGLDQRDDHTIASDLARLAHGHGMRVVVENRGVLGNSHWQEAERFAYDLTIDAPPDLVLFYDGVNETWAANVLNNLHAGDLRVPIDSTAVDLWDRWSKDAGPAPAAPPGARLIGWDRDTSLQTSALGRLTMTRYDRARKMSKATATHHHIPVVYVWQPSRVSRPVVAAEPHGDADSETFLRQRQEAQRRWLADDVVDLTDVFDDTTAPLFTDDVHHNERGAQIVAEAIYGTISPMLSDLQSGGGR